MERRTQKFNEDTRVKIPATIQFLKLGYEYQSLSNAEIDFNTKIFIKRFKNSIEIINKRDFTFDEIKEILIEVNNVIRNNDLGKSFYNWLINPMDKVKLIDLDNINNNNFAIVDELPYCITEGTEEGSFRPDINILINGIPLAFLEVKKPNNEGGIQKEFKRMINDRLQNSEYNKFFNMLQIVSFSNNMKYEESDDIEDVKAGSFYTTPNGQNTSFSFFREEEPEFINEYQYKNISEEEIKDIIKDCGYNPEEVGISEFEENLKITAPCNSFITSIFDKERFLYFIKYGMLFVDGKVPQKHIMRYPQFFACRKIIERLKNGGKSGIIWHTQGSGKTGLTAFANRIIKDYYSKEDINTRFFFVVDRLDLLRQATIEFKKRGLNVINCNNKAEFTKELNKSLSTNITSDAIGEICVVNIQKFEGEIPQAKNEYNTNVQRVFFIDEAHRSYSTTGEFFKNLITCDLNAVYIALTGTPLLTPKERTRLKFGDYIHTYFYDKSIDDGYTLRIKKEHIDTVVKAKLKRNLELEKNEVDEKNKSKAVYESDDYINDLCQFIENDFVDFRFRNNDPIVGGMVVCRSNPQAKKINEWFEKNSDVLKTGLVMTDEEDKEQGLLNKENQQKFRDTTKPDLLIVNLMLTTGFDVNRLKKMYLLRGPHAQSLLQTISRVNRPYKSTNGKVYKYGYIVDFIDIEKEYENTIGEYIKELEDDLNSDGESSEKLTGLVIDKEDIYKKYKKLSAELEEIIEIDNLEKFSKRLFYLNKDALLKIRRILNEIKECKTEFILSKATDYANEIDSEKNKKLLRTVQERIDFINLSTNTVEMLNIISNKEVVEIIYEFIKTKITIMDLGKFSPNNPSVEKFTEVVKVIQKEIKDNKNKDDIRIIKLDELLQDIFNELSISNLDNLDELTDELIEALKEARNINEENNRLSKIYDGHFAFVKTYKDSIEKYNNVEPEIIEKMLIIIYNHLKDLIETDVLTMQGKKNFIDNVKYNITKILLREKLFSKIKNIYDYILGDLYTNIQIFR